MKMDGSDQDENSESVEYRITSLADDYEGSDEDIISLGKKLEEITDNRFTYEELESSLDVYRGENADYRFAALQGMIIGGKVGENEFLDPDDVISAEFVEQTLEEDYEITDPDIDTFDIGSTVGNNGEE
jgi:hypothetical protein